MAGGAAEKSLREQLFHGETPTSIIFPTLEKSFKLSPGFIHLLPKFYGNSNEDALKHTQEFHFVCSTYSLEGVADDIIKFRAFPFTLHDLARDWLFNLPAGSINSWDCLRKAFLEKYQPPSVTRAIRKQITSIEQDENESLNDYWDRFNRLCISCPQHQLSENLLIEYFYDGLLLDQKRLIDIASGGSLVDKTPTEARKLISNMAINAQQYGIKYESQVKIQKQLKEQAEQIKELKEVMTNHFEIMNKQNQVMTTQHQSLENMVRQLVTHIGNVHSLGHIRREQTETHLHNLDNQMKSICVTLNTIQCNFDKNNVETNSLRSDKEFEEIGKVDKEIEVDLDGLTHKSEEKGDHGGILNDDAEIVAQVKESDGKMHPTSCFYSIEFDPWTMVPYPSRFLGSKVGKTCERSKVDAIVTNEAENEFEATNGDCERSMRGFKHDSNYLRAYDDFDFDDDFDDDDQVGFKPDVVITKKHFEEIDFEESKFRNKGEIKCGLENEIKQVNEPIGFNILTNVQLSIDPPWGIPDAEIDDYFEVPDDIHGFSMVDNAYQGSEGMLSYLKPFFSMFESASLSSIDNHKYTGSNDEWVNMEQFYDHREWRETLCAKFEYHLQYCLCILLLHVSKLLLHLILSAKEMALAIAAFKGFDKLEISSL